MPIPPNFQFSQGSLQDYLDCRQRFYLRYIRRLAWPAVESEPVLENERYVQQGQRFHTLVYQSLVGIPSTRLDRMIQDQDLALWWQNFQADLSGLGRQGEALYPETPLSAALGGFSLVAKCDLVVVSRDGAARIFDWKTSQERTERGFLARRLQTRVYPYLLVKAGAHLNGGRPFSPEAVEMVYWFARFPGRPERFSYSQAQFEADERYLGGLVAEIAGLAPQDFQPNTDSRRSKTCVYRSLCDHGQRVGALDEAGSELDPAPGLDLDLDFETLPEVAF